MLKIKYVYECHFDDEESVELMFAQSYYEYFTGRIRLDLEDLGFLAASVNKLKFGNLPKSEFKKCYSIWVTKEHSEKDLENALTKSYNLI